MRFACPDGEGPLVSGRPGSGTDEAAASERPACRAGTYDTTRQPWTNNLVH